MKFQIECKHIKENRKVTKRIKKVLLVFIFIIVVAVGLVGLVWRTGALQDINKILTSWPFSLAQVGQEVDKESIVRFAVLSDSHQDTQYFPQIVDQIAKRQDLAFVAHLGDLSDAGDKTKLQQGKQVLDQIPSPVYVLPGDHDYNWFPNHDLTNFMQVMGQSKTYFSFDQQDFHFLFIDNSDLNQGIESAQWQWLTEDLQAHSHQSIYIFMSTPLSNPYIAYKAMGARSEAVQQQSKQLGQLLKTYPVKVIFTGDTHSFAQFKDTDSGLPLVGVGAAGSTKNLLPLYVIVDIFSDGSYNVASQPYKNSIPVQGKD